jgi:PAS domain S-box-containing protein
MTDGHPFTWPPEDARVLFDAVDDAVIASDDEGMVVYANRAGHRMLGWPAGTLIGRPVSDLVPEGLHVWTEQTFGEFVDSAVAPLEFRPVEVTLVARDGRRVPVEISINLIQLSEDRIVVLGVLRPQGDRSRLTRWEEIARALLDSLTVEGVEPERFLLQQLAQRLGWDIALFWTFEEGQGPALQFRSAWSAHEHAIDPALTDIQRGAEELDFPARILKLEQPVWIADLAHDDRLGDAIPSRLGLSCAFGFPVFIGNEVSGVVELFCYERRQPNPELPDLLAALGAHIGGVLAALRRSEERQQLIDALESARRYQAFLLDANKVLAAAPEYADVLDRLAQLAVPALADLCLIDVREDADTVRRMVVRHANPALTPLIDELRSTDIYRHVEDGPVIQAIRTGRSVQSEELTEGILVGFTSDARRSELAQAIGITSYMIVPMVVEDEVLGTVTLASAGSGRSLQAQDLALAEELTSQVAFVVDRARTHQRDQQISHTLQRTLLPDRLPELPFADLAARYLPGTDYLEVGGDWYDVIQLGPTVAAFVVGDVEGHDMIATSIMGRLRPALGAFILQHKQPGSALTDLNRFAEATNCDRIATVLVVIFDSTTRQLTLASAGHPPPILVSAGGARTATLTNGPPICVPASGYGEARVELENGDGLLLFTDGLVERRATGLDEGIAALVDTVNTASSRDPGSLCDYILERFGTGANRADDIALLALRARGMTNA